MRRPQLALSIAVTSLLIAGCNWTARVSVGTGGTQAAAGGTVTGISGDGRFVSFTSTSPLAAGDTNNINDLFVHDNATNATVRATLKADGTQLYWGANGGGISANGRCVVFDTNESVLPSTSFVWDVYVRDLVTGIVKRASVDSAGHQSANMYAASTGAALDDDCRYVAFSSRAADFVSAPDANDDYDVFLHDLVTGATVLVSANPSGVAGNSASGGLSSPLAISDDGRYVAFGSSATDLVAGDPGRGVFRRDLLNGLTERVAGPGAASPSMSADGRYVAYVQSAGYGTAPGVFVHDMLVGVTDLVSVSTTGVPANGSSGGQPPSISGDGRYVAFTTDATNLDPGDTAGGQDWDIYLRDRYDQTTRWVGRGAIGHPGNYGGQGPRLSADGNFLAFSSPATNLVAGDTNGNYDVFVQSTRIIGVTDVDPVAAHPGDHVVLTIRGSHFAPGDQVFMGVGITTTAVDYLGSTELRAHVTIAPDAVLGARSAVVYALGPWPGVGAGEAGAYLGAFAVTA